MSDDYEKDQTDISFKDPKWLEIFPLNKDTVLDYFSRSSFYDRFQKSTLSSPNLSPHFRFLDLATMNWSECNVWIPQLCNIWKELCMK